MARGGKDEPASLPNARAYSGSGGGQKVLEADVLTAEEEEGGGGGEEFAL